MKEFSQGGKVWDYDHLASFLLAPKADVKGTAMGFAGVKKADDRANLIAYLRTLSDSPAPLPEAAAPAPEDASAPAEGAEGAAPVEPAPAEPAPAPAKPAPVCSRRPCRACSRGTGSAPLLPQPEPAPAPAEPAPAEPAPAPAEPAPAAPAQ